MKVGSFSWRLLIGWFLVLFGGLLCVVITLHTVVYSYSLRMTPPRPMLEGSVWSIAIGTILQFASGVIWLYSGRRVLSKQTWQPIVGCILGYVCGVAGALMLWPGGVYRP
jgi:hypothetical protein